MKFERYEAMKVGRWREVLPDNGSEERVGRIVTTSLEVFSECSFRDATTEEIARRARVSKRDLYARFPNKYALLIAVVETILREDDENIAMVISLTKDFPSLQAKLEVIGLALINEVLSLAMAFLARIIPSESISRPLVGTIYFENRHARRGKLIAEVLSSHASNIIVTAVDTNQAAEHFLALVSYKPYMSALVGIRDMWDSNSAEIHVKEAVGCFLRAYQSTYGVGI